MSMLKADRNNVLKSAAARVCLPHCIRMPAVRPQFQLRVLLLLLPLCYNANDTVHKKLKYA